MNVRSIGRLGLAVALGVSLAACGQVQSLKAKKHFKDANALYQQQEYRKAAAEYEAALAADPTLTAAYFYLGNSYDQLYKPARQGEPENDAYLHKAVENYKKAIEREQDPKMKKLALQYLVEAYSPEKLNDPAQAEPLIQNMINLDPSDVTNYFALAKLYEDGGRYEDAEKALLMAKEKRPKDPSVFMQLARFYNDQGEFDKTMEALYQRAEVEPNNPEAFHTIATYFWDKSYRDKALKDPQKREYVMKGIEATDKALALKPDYMEALVYKNLLLRLQANLEKDPAKQQALLKEADALRDKANEIRKQKAAGTGD